MDVWRYSDWAGFGAQVRDSQPFVWHWRDWIVESLNADKPYDRMAQEMLAADELAPTDPDALRATGYLVRNYKLLSREKWLQDAVDHTSMAFLGLTLGCAGATTTCSTRSRRRSITRSAPSSRRTTSAPTACRAAPLTADGLPRAFDADPKALTHLLVRGDDRTPDKKPLAPGVPESLGGSFDRRRGRPAARGVPAGAAGVRPRGVDRVAREDGRAARQGDCRRTHRRSPRAAVRRADADAGRHSPSSASGRGSARATRWPARPPSRSCASTASSPPWSGWKMTDKTSRRSGKRPPAPSSPPNAGSRASRRGTGSTRSATGSNLAPEDPARRSSSPTPRKRWAPPRPPRRPRPRRSTRRARSRPTRRRVRAGGSPSRAG